MNVAARPVHGGHPDLPPAGTTGEWRCFHCELVCTNWMQARMHFGPSLYSAPACQIDAAHLRDLEAQLSRYREEDTDLHRQIHGMQSEHQQALLREEEKGYRRGLADGHRFPADAAMAAGVDASDATPKCDRCKDTGWHYSDPFDPTSLEPCCEPTGVLVVDEPSSTLREFLEHWTHEGHLQTFEDRERFRKAARELLAAGVAPSDGGQQ